MNTMDLLAGSDLDVQIDLPVELLRIHSQNLVDLTPWHLLRRELAIKRLQGLRQRYSRKYVPFAYRQDNDDIACIDPAMPHEVVIIHDFSSNGSEVRQRLASFLDRFRLAVEEMIAFE